MTVSEIKLFLCCLCFRITNSFFVQTYFYPDEFWQGPEIAHKIIFGYGHLSWEWVSGLRSIIHPLLFSLPYYLLKILGIDTVFLVKHSPRMVQSLFATATDIYVYKISERLFGSRAAWCSLFCQMTLWFNFYCSVRTYVNCTEGCLMIMVLYHWPKFLEYCGATRKSENEGSHRLLCIFLIGLTALIRPTSIPFWSLFGLHELIKLKKDRIRFITEIALLATIIISGNLMLDSYFYKKFVFPPWEFFKFNVIKGGAITYGSQSWHWYITQAIPAILGTYLLLLFIALRHCKKYHLFLWTIPFILTYSLSPHKEFRFVYPLCPIFMCYCGFGLLKMLDFINGYKNKRLRYSLKYNILIFILLLLPQLAANVYFSQFHQRGVISVMDFLSRKVTIDNVKGILIVLPPHSTPMYSYIHKNIPIRFLDRTPKEHIKKVLEANKDLGTLDGYQPLLLDERNYTFESDVAKRNLSKWLDDVINNDNSKSNSYSHIVSCDSIQNEIEEVLAQNEYKFFKSFFNAHFDQMGWDCKRILLFAKN